ncbi:LemA family protein [Pseudaquidulcibacter saccharophilus]|uniref:LemA family protein n=1 Tax=Pseudaquidulcibacter saccharophilus TaxID=2831900 RepID=UPI001EFF4B74|nr:LemA family protein [Pseudaquidulcibacter saccharophilus]
MNISRRFLAIGALAVAATSLGGCGYNTIPTKEEAAKAAWAEVQNQYQRRADLVPNLVATVQGAAKQEKDVLTAVVEARASATSPKFDASTITDEAKFKEFQASQDKLSGALGRLMMVTENYPQLKSLDSFNTLQSQLEGTENRIAIARRDYNAAVQDYNTTLKTFPSIIWASTFQSGSKPMQMFTATAGAEKAPEVKF